MIRIGSPQRGHDSGRHSSVRATSNAQQRAAMRPTAVRGSPASDDSERASSAAATGYGSPIFPRASSSTCATAPAGPAVAVTAARSFAFGASSPYYRCWC